MAKPHVFIGRAEQFRIMMGHVLAAHHMFKPTEREIFERAFHHAEVESYEQAADWALTKCEAESWSDSSVPEAVMDYLLDRLSDLREGSERRVKSDSTSGFKLSQVAEKEKNQKK